MVNYLFLSHLPERLQSILFQYDKIRFSSQPPGVFEIQEILKTHQEDLTEYLLLADKTKNICDKKEIRYTTFWSPDYPEKLKAIDRPPLILFYKGTLPSQIPTLSVVGSRSPDQYGTQVAVSILSRVKTRPIQIVSGLALGIDSLAHRISCELSIQNYAVLAHGLETIYPSQNFNLSEKILTGGGGLISEFPPETQMKAFYFPRRNRIISAFCDVLWVIQGTYKSGTRHTIEHASKQGKTVAATPGNLFNALSEVPNRLILEGAHCVLSATDLEILLEIN